MHLSTTLQTSLLLGKGGEGGGGGGGGRQEEGEKWWARGWRKGRGRSGEEKVGGMGEVKGEIVGRTERDTVCVCVCGGGGGGGASVICLHATVGHLCLNG